MQITCPYCDAPLRPKPEWAGRTVTCKKCNGRFVLPLLTPSVQPTLDVAAESCAETDAVIARTDTALEEADAIATDSALAGLREKMADAEVSGRIALTACNAALASHSAGLVDPEACEDAAHALKVAAMKFRVVVAESEILSTVDPTQATLLRSKAAEAVIRCEDTATTLRNTAMNARDAAEQGLADINAIAVETDAMIAQVDAELEQANTRIADSLFAAFREKRVAAEAATRAAMAASRAAMASYSDGLCDPEACDDAARAYKIAAMKWRAVVTEAEALVSVVPDATDLCLSVTGSIVECEDSAATWQSTAMSARGAAQQVQLLHNLQNGRTGCLGVIAILVIAIAAASAMAS